MIRDEFNKLKRSNILRQFNNWHQLIARGATIDEMKPEIYKLIKGCLFETFISTNILHFRARKNDNSSLFTKISEIWYPPNEFVKAMGRANRKGQSMTYIAQDGRTALFELNPKKNDFVTVCHLTLKKGQSLNLIYLYTLKKLESLSFEKHFKERDERLLSYGFTKHGIKNIDTIHDLLSQEFMKIDNSHPENAYTISVAISEIMLSYDKIDGIIYPSLRSPLDYNIVLKNKSADRALRVKRCDFMEITKNVNREIFIRHLFTTSRINKQKNELIWSTNIEDGLGWLTEDTLSLVEFTQD